MTDLLTRIQEVISWTSLGPTAFADEIGVARPVISHILSARNKASLEVVQKIISRFPEISTSWILSGEGEMLGEGIASSNRVANHKEQPIASPRSGTSNSLTQEARKDQGKEIASSAGAGVANEIETKRLVRVMLFYSDGSVESYDPTLKTKE